MAIQVYEGSSFIGNKRVIETFDNYAEAKAYVLGLGVIDYEDDNDYPNCGDAYLNDGRCIHVQPEGLKV